MYLIREDGIVVLLNISTDGKVQSSLAGDAECHAGSAFASLGDPSDPDILAIGGEQSSGRVISMGLFQSGGRLIGEMSRVDTMTMRRIELLPNWASATDMLVSTLPQSYGRSTRMRDSVFVTSGRRDLPFCGGDCQAGDVVSGVQALYPATKNFTSYIVPDTGHGIVPHYTGPQSQRMTVQFFADNGL